MQNNDIQTNKSWKQDVYNAYFTTVVDKIKRLQHNLAELKESGSNETKSTAGDKHETALAMLQIEQAKNREQLLIAQQQQEALQRTKNMVNPAKIINGSLVKTSLGHFYICTALGKAVVANVVVQAISAQSPLGNILIGLSVQQSFTINNSHGIIEAIE